MRAYFRAGALATIAEPSASFEPRRTPRGSRVLVLLSAGLVALAFATGADGRGWLVQLLLVVALAQGFVAGAVFPAFWRIPPGERGGGGRASGRASGRGPGAGGRSGSPGPDGARAGGGTGIGLLARLVGPEGRYLLFQVSVAFAAVEAHAVGTGMGAGAPAAAAALLLPPLAVAGVALRAALRSAPGR